MKTLILNDVAAMLGWSVLQGDGAFEIEKVTRDPAKVSAGSLLFLPKAKHNIKDILSRLQCKKVCLVSDAPLAGDGLDKAITAVRVDCVETAYWDFLGYYRNLFNLPIVGVTGTCGKTTTKEMIKHILNQSHKVQATFYSNNTVGLNLDYLMGIDDSTQAAVFEMGVAYPGNLLSSCRCFQPTIGVITTIGIDHLAGCKTMDNYIKAKAEMVAGLQYQGTLVLNGDNSYIKQIDLSGYSGTVLYFGQGKHCDYRAIDISYGEHGMEFSLIYKNKVYPGLVVPGLGEHNVYNALAAIAASSAAIGINACSAALRLQNFSHIPRHLEIHKGINGATILDDTWSSNPTSTEAALDVLRTIGQGKTKIAVLGKMSLLGASADQFYTLIGQKAAKTVDHLVVIREEASKIALSAVNSGLNLNVVYTATTEEAALSYLRPLAGPNTVILVKTSMEDSFAALTQGLLRAGT